MTIGEVDVLELLLSFSTAIGGTTEVGGISILGWSGVGGWTCKPGGAGIAGGTCRRVGVFMADGNAVPPCVPDMLIGLDAPAIPPVDPDSPVGADIPAGDDMPNPADMPGTVTSLGDVNIPVVTAALFEAGAEVAADDRDAPVCAGARAAAGEFDGGLGGNLANGAVKEFALFPAAAVGGAPELDGGAVGCVFAANSTALVDIFATSVPIMITATTARDAPIR